MDDKIKMQYQMLLNIKYHMNLEYEKLPRGKIYVARTKGHIYYYLEVKEANKIVSTYIREKDALQIGALIERRESLLLKIKEVDLRIRNIKKYLNN